MIRGIGPVYAKRLLQAFREKVFEVIETAPERLREVEVAQDGKRFLLRSEAQGTCGRVFQTVGVAMPPTVRQIEGGNGPEEPLPGATPMM